MERKDLITALRNNQKPMASETPAEINSSVLDLHLSTQEVQSSVTYQSTPNQRNTDANKDGLMIGAGVVFNGEVTVPGQAVISGTFAGTLTADELVVEATGVASGTIQCRTILAKGTVKEKVDCKELLVIKSTGNVSGDVRYGQIEIERGGAISGALGIK